MNNEFILSIASGATLDAIKKGTSLTIGALKKKLSKWLADDIISEIYTSIEKAPPFCLESKEKLESYLRMNSDLISRLDLAAGKNSIQNTVYQDVHDVSGIMAGVINGPVTQYTNEEMPRRAGCEPFSIIQDYLQSRTIQIIKSYSSTRDIPRTGVSEKGVLFVHSTFVPPPQESQSSAFVMTLFSYIPPENWTEFASSGRRIEFEIEASPGIESIQLQIKDSSQKQFVDIPLGISGGRATFSKKMVELAPLSAWKDVGELCFTIFSENCSVWGQPFSCKVSDFFLSSR